MNVQFQMIFAKKMNNVISGQTTIRLMNSFFPLIVNTFVIMFEYARENEVVKCPRLCGMLELVTFDTMSLKLISHFICLNEQSCLADQRS